MNSDSCSQVLLTMIEEAIAFSILSLPLSLISLLYEMLRKIY